MLYRGGLRCAAYVALTVLVGGCQPAERKGTPDRPVYRVESGSDEVPVLASHRVGPLVLDRGPAIRRTHVVTFARPGAGAGNVESGRRSHIAVPVSLNGGPPRAFLLDTGAAVTTVLVSRELMDTLVVGRKLERSDAVQIRGISGATTTAYGATARSVAVGSSRTGPFRYVVMAAERDLSDLGDTPYGPVVGILGNDFLSRYRVTVDYARRTVSLEGR